MSVRLKNAVEILKIKKISGFTYLCFNVIPVIVTGTGTAAVVSVTGTASVVTVTRVAAVITVTGTAASVFH